MDGRLGWMGLRIAVYHSNVPFTSWYMFAMVFDIMVLCSLSLGRVLWGFVTLLSICMVVCYCNVRTSLSSYVYWCRVCCSVLSCEFFNCVVLCYVVILVCV